MKVPPGWVKLWRSSLTDEDFLERPFCKWKALQDVRLQANYKPGTITFNGELVTVEAGSFITSLRKLATRWGWGVGKVFNFLETLQGRGIIQYSANHRHCVVTVLDAEQNRTVTDTVIETPTDTVTDTVNGNHSASLSKNGQHQPTQSPTQSPIHRPDPTKEDKKKEDVEGGAASPPPLPRFTTVPGVVPWTAPPPHVKAKADAVVYRLPKDPKRPGCIWLSEQQLAFLEIAGVSKEEIVHLADEVALRLTSDDSYWSRYWKYHDHSALLQRFRKQLHGRGQFFRGVQSPSGAFTNVLRNEK